MKPLSQPDLKSLAVAVPRLNATRILFACALGGGLAAAVSAQPSPTMQAGDDRWRLIGQSVSMRLYYEPASIARQDEIRRVRELQDLDVADPDGVRSRVYLNEYDCRNQMHRIGQMQSFAGPMLGGQRRFEVKEMGYWRRIPAGSAFAQVYRQVCPDGQALPAAEPAPPLQRLFSKD
jgi:hypothetical protein